MGRLVVSMFSTLDGVMQGPGAVGEDVEGGFAFSGWQAPFGDAEAGATIMANILATDALLLGRRTYDIWVTHWPHQPASDPIGARFNAIPKFVASRTLADPEWEGTTVLPDLAEVAALKDRFDEIGVWGSGELLPGLLAHGLVDRIDLWTYPLVLGAGKRVFRDGTAPTGLTLDGPAQTFSSGVVLTRYGRGPDPEFGTI